MMENNDILKFIKEKAERERTDILENARVEAERLIENARSTARDMESGVREKVQAEAGRLRERRANAEGFRQNADRYREKAAAIENIWQKAGKRVAEIESSDHYPGILRALFEESAEDAPDGAVVAVASDGESIVRKCIGKSKKNFDLIVDDSVKGGIEFRWDKGRTVLRNTLGARLSRLKAEGNAGVAGILFKPDGEERS